MAAPDLQEVHDVLLSLATKAGAMILAANLEANVSMDNKKNSADPVTETDKAVESMIDTILRDRFPDCDFVGEETHKGQPMGNGPTFVVDPIDGTTNFIHSFPNVCISLGFCIKQQPVVGIIHNPFTGLLWSAKRGDGAFVRSVGPTGFQGISQQPRRLPLKPSKPLPGLSAALLGIEWGSDREGNNWDARLELFSKLGGATQGGGGMAHGFRSTGTAALNMCSVANGELDVAWEAGAWAWDVCAGWTIVEEAGGRLVDAHPRPNASTWQEKAPRLDGRLYLAIRPAEEEEQEKLVQEIWDLTTMRFRY